MFLVFPVFFRVFSFGVSLGGAPALRSHHPWHLFFFSSAASCLFWSVHVVPLISDYFHLLSPGWIVVSVLQCIYVRFFLRITSDEDQTHHISRVLAACLRYV
ncbi:hypothetical protein Droror1_Dr00018765 [Drosera rotundifolia]